MDIQEPPQLLSALRVNMAESIGTIIASLFHGGLLSMGIHCIFLLSPKEAKATKQQRFWQTYITILLLINAPYQAAFFMWNNYWIIYASDPVKQVEVLRILSTIGNSVPIFLAGMADSVLVWRCYMVQKALDHRPSRLRAIFWVFPLVLWLITYVAGSIGSALRARSSQFSPGTVIITAASRGSSIFQTVGLTANVLLALYSTSFISIRLLLHRRMLNSYLGEHVVTTRHLHIVGILLESAAINIPVTIAGAIGIATSQIFGRIIISIAVECQCFAAVLILYQVALGRAFGQRKDIETLPAPGDSRRICLDIDDNRVSEPGPIDRPKTPEICLKDWNQRTPE